MRDSVSTRKIEIEVTDAEAARIRDAILRGEGVRVAVGEARRQNPSDSEFPGVDEHGVPLDLRDYEDDGWYAWDSNTPEAARRRAQEVKKRNDALRQLDEETQRARGGQPGEQRRARTRPAYPPRLERLISEAADSIRNTILRTDDFPRISNRVLDLLPYGKEGILAYLHDEMKAKSDGYWGLYPDAAVYKARTDRQKGLYGLLADLAGDGFDLPESVDSLLIYDWRVSNPDTARSGQQIFAGDTVTIQKYEPTYTKGQGWNVAKSTQSRRKVAKATSTRVTLLDGTAFRTRATREHGAWTEISDSTWQATPDTIIAVNGKPLLD